MVELGAHERCLRALVALRDAQMALCEADGETAGDSTERKRAELGLLVAGDQLSAAFGAVPELLLELGLDGSYGRARSSGTGSPATPGDGIAGENVADLFAPEAAEVVLSALREAHEEGVSIGEEFELQLPHGSSWLAISAFRKAVDRGEDPRFFLVLRDVTEGKRADQRRRQVFRFFELSTDPMCIADPYGCFKQVNPAFSELTGFSQAELVSRPFMEFVVPEDRERTAEEMKLQVAVRPSMRFENRYRCKDGRVVTLSWTAYFDENDGVTYATARDITDRKRREDEYHTIIQASLDGFAVTEYSGRLLDVNESTCRLLGYSREELLCMSVADIEVGATPEELEARTRETIRVGSVLFQARHRRKDATVIDVEVSAVAVPTLGARFYAFVRDINERKQAETSLRETRRLLEEVEKLSKLGGWQYDVATGRVVATEELFRIGGVDKNSDLSDLSATLGFYAPEDAPKIAEAFSRAVVEGEPYDLEVQLIRSNGERVWVRTIGTPRAENGKVVSITGNIIDISEQKQMREALCESEQRLRTVFETEPECVKLVARDGRLVEMNRTGIAMLEANSLAEVQERTLLGFVVPEDRAAFTALHQRVMNGQAGILEFQMETMTGARRWVETHAAPMRDAKGEVAMLLGISRDITDRKKAEQERRLIEAQLRESQKMEALGALAGGVAHDFNNIIASIMGNVELARRDVGPAHPAVESLDEINKASHRAKDLVRQILAFGRRQVSSREPVSLATVVEEAGRLLRTTLPAGIGLKVECAADVPTVLADVTQVEQVVLNLCGNAWHAIQGQERPGLIEVRLEAYERAADQAQDSGAAVAYGGDLASGRYACLTVRDNGSGMDDDTRAHIFEPFFTTKPVGSGTGLGLAVVHGIVQEHGASVEVQSAPGEGSTFRVYFPAVDGTVPAAVAKAPGAAPALDGHGKHVLFVDDDEAIVFLMKRLLERQGYQVSAYTDPRAAIEAARAQPDRFDLAVTDYNMSGMSGLEVARQLRQIRSDLPVALASGYITDELRAQAPQVGVSELIFKPNTVDELCAAVARMAARTSRC
ncbi:MAG: PAS domain S-box protein [Deltaproteobacteria bacterium]|nr:PAS domain S-box protein [Deltaproteobacteria bacterium]